MTGPQIPGPEVPDRTGPGDPGSPPEVPHLPPDPDPGPDAPMGDPPNRTGPGDPGERATPGAPPEEIPTHTPGGQPSEEPRRSPDIPLEAPSHGLPEPPKG